MKKRKGFTLIELLAVIVILGLLMAIAIPSVTKYITQSRKKTVTTTVGNYISALTTQVNDMEYTFTATNTVYAVPIECIALERGGTDPFGKWHQANNAYWAYVLVQYNDVTSSYTYGFTFKDSAGYGLYPTTSEKLKESGSQINTDLALTRPTTGKVTNITAVGNWTGFNVDTNTNLIVLIPTSENGVGDGKTTCTLCQKGDNYTEVEAEKVGGGAVPAYTLDGVWHFNDEVIVDVNQASLKTKINFVSNGKNYTWMYIGNDSIVLPNGNINKSYGLNYTTSEPAPMNYGDFAFGYGPYSPSFGEGPGNLDTYGWYNDAYKRVEFKTPQNVSQEFYNWFTSNASQN